MLALDVSQSSDNVVMKDELKSMKRVLRRLGYSPLATGKQPLLTRCCSFVSAEHVIEVKGRVACEINAADEIVLTELIFNGFFNDLSPELVPPAAVLVLVAHASSHMLPVCGAAVVLRV